MGDMCKENTTADVVEDIVDMNDVWDKLINKMDDFGSLAGGKLSSFLDLTTVN